MWARNRCSVSQGFSLPRQGIPVPVPLMQVCPSAPPSTGPAAASTCRGALSEGGAAQGISLLPPVQPGWESSVVIPIVSPLRELHLAFSQKDSRMCKVFSHLLSPQLLQSVSSGCGNEVVLGRRPKGGKGNILGVEKLLADFPPWAFR